MVLGIPVVVGLWLRWTRNQLCGTVNRLRFPALSAWGLAGLVLAFWVLRNLPATSWLAP